MDLTFKSSKIFNINRIKSQEVIFKEDQNAMYFNTSNVIAQACVWEWIKGLLWPDCTKYIQGCTQMHDASTSSLPRSSVDMSVYIEQMNRHNDKVNELVNNGSVDRVVAEMHIKAIME
ncbi:hypothetical protein L6452_05861 [Arctium lappa]|uniref:Uncharacterized protein n=1 Tax=Arctium lappa TaxID=4217 RepID=A0ACB9EHI7_ARCLA|nr:hypothetical protein L6452_05861 [Arctium lappa]